MGQLFLELHTEDTIKLVEGNIIAEQNFLLDYCSQIFRFYHPCSSAQTIFLLPTCTLLFIYFKNARNEENRHFNKYWR